MLRAIKKTLTKLFKEFEYSMVCEHCEREKCPMIRMPMMDPFLTYWPVCPHKYRNDKQEN